MKIVNRKISELIFADYNPRKATEKQMQDIRNSIEKFGCIDPIIINTNPDRKNVIVGGHRRVEVMKSLGKRIVPTVEVNLDLEAEKELNVRLNKNTGEFDFQQLANFFKLESLRDWGFEDVDLGKIDIGMFGEEFKLPDGDREPFQQMTFTLADEQAEQIKNAIADIKQTEEYKYVETMGNENSNGNALYLIVMQWAEQKK